MQTLKKNQLVFIFILLMIFILILTQILYLNELILLKKDGIAFNYNCEPILNNNTQFRIQIDGIYYPNRVPLYHNRSINFECLNSSTNIKTILWWTKFNGLPFKNYGFGIRKPFVDMNCPVTNCELTNDRSKFSKSDLVLFHLRNQIDYIPERAFNEQRYVHIIYESPINCHLCTKYENTFNFSSTYTTDSDFASIYWTDSGLYYDYNSKFDDKLDYSANKTEIGAALISNCRDSFRTKYLNEVNKYLPVKIYGKCGTQCPSEKDCREYIADNYKFFFVFENSLCRDYMTEKIFDTLRYNTIPVVMGIGNYSYYIPKSGFINSLDFKSPKDLADYLLYLSKNKTAYNAYFKWKKYIRFDLNVVQAGYLCEMCIKLNLEEAFGYIEEKKLNDLKIKYGLSENCFVDHFDENKNFFVKNITKNIYSYFMSPE